MIRNNNFVAINNLIKREVKMIKSNYDKNNLIKNAMNDNVRIKEKNNNLNGDKISWEIVGLSISRIITIINGKSVPIEKNLHSLT